MFKAYLSSIKTLWTTPGMRRHLPAFASLVILTYLVITACLAVLSPLILVMFLSSLLLWLCEKIDESPTLATIAWYVLAPGRYLKERLMELTDKLREEYNAFKEEAEMTNEGDGL